MISLIACVDSENGIGLDGTIPWSLKPDMKYFREMTVNTIIIMGRRTWESIGSKPLPKRVNIVVTSNPAAIDSNAIACICMKDAIDLAASLLKPIFIIGGSAIYKETIPFATRIYLTRIKRPFNCDTFFPFQSIEHFKSDIGPWNEYKDIEYRFETYSK